MSRVWTEDEVVKAVATAWEKGAADLADYVQKGGTLPAEVKMTKAGATNIAYEFGLKPRWPDVDERVFLGALPADTPDWLRDKLPPEGSSGKADHIVAGAVWVNWGGGDEGWVPLAWLRNDSDDTDPPETAEDALNELRAPGERYRAALEEVRAARTALIPHVQRALALKAPKAHVADRAHVKRPDLYNAPWKP